MKSDYQYNVLGLGEVFLDRYKETLSLVTDIVIQQVDKNKEIVEEHTIFKENLPNELLNVFNNGVKELSEIRICYIKDRLVNYLTSIEIF
jgi:hypothetical protein